MREIHIENKGSKIRCGRAIFKEGVGRGREFKLIFFLGRGALSEAPCWAGCDGRGGHVRFGGGREEKGVGRRVAHTGRGIFGGGDRVAHWGRGMGVVQKWAATWRPEGRGAVDLGKVG